MKEWPKRVLVYQPPTQVDIPGGDGDEVIPADLGRELYEALKAETDYNPNLPLYKATDDALARYEREVGK